MCDNCLLFRNTLNYGTEEAQDVSKCVNVVIAVYLCVVFCRTLQRSIYIAVPLVVVVYFLINLSFFAVLSVYEITEATAVALVCNTLHPIVTMGC